MKDKQPRFFLAENVSGMLHKKHENALRNIIAAFEEAGYVISYKLLNARHYHVPQDRKRVIFIGYHIDLNKCFDFNVVVPGSRMLTLRDALWNLRESAIPALVKRYIFIAPPIFSFQSLKNRRFFYRLHQYHFSILLLEFQLHRQKPKASYLAF